MGSKKGTIEGHQEGGGPFQSKMMSLDRLQRIVFTVRAFISSTGRGSFGGR